MAASATTDVAIIGAGAAGIAAARRLAERGFCCRILEARSRAGGRAWTETTSLGVPLDRGCAWLHDGERNPLRPYAEAAGLAIPSEIPIRAYREGRFASPEANAALEAEVQRGLQAVSTRARQEPDGDTARLLPSAGTNTPILRYILTAVAGVEPEHYASGDAAEEDAFESNWLVHGGLGRLITQDLGAGIPASFATPVERVDYRRLPIRLATAAGTLCAQGVIITVSPAVLAAGRPGFRPGLPGWKSDAIADIRMGHAEKVAIRFRGAPFGTDKAHFLTIERPDGLMGFHIEPGPPAVALAYTGGNLARAIAEGGEADAVAVAMDYLAHAYGQKLRQCVVASTATSWAEDPWSLGSYSAARPGTHHQRTALATPVNARLRFAGEATLDEAFATAHGAWLSGIREADAIAAELADATTPAPWADRS